MLVMTLQGYKSVQSKDDTGQLYTQDGSPIYARDNEISGMSLFVQQQLQYLEPEIYSVLYPELTYDKVIPVVSGGAGAQTLAYTINDRSGEAQLLTSYGKDLERASAGTIRKYRNYYGYGISAVYSQQELAAANFANLPLEGRLLESARQGSLIRLNKIAYFGDKAIDTNDLYGLFNNTEVAGLSNDSSTLPDFPKVTLPGTTTPATWAAAVAAAAGTPADLDQVANQILDQINYMFSTVNTRSEGANVADTLLLPRAQWNLIANARVSAFTQETILSRLLANSPYISSVDDIMAINELAYSNAQIGADGTVNPFGIRKDINGAAMPTSETKKDAMFVYRRDARSVKLHIGVPFEFVQPEYSNLQYTMNGWMTTAGTIAYYPLSQLMAFGI